MQWGESARRADLVTRFNTVMGDPDPVLAEVQQSFVAGDMDNNEIKSLARLYNFLLDAAEQG
jgi:hypothetical protein